MQHFTQPVTPYGTVTQRSARLGLSISGPVISRVMGFYWYFDDRLGWVIRLIEYSESKGIALQLVVVLFVSCPVMLFMFSAALAMWVGLGLALIGVKVLATLMSVLEDFPALLESLAVIPSNWANLVFAVDSCRPPEVLPGIESEVDIDQMVISFRVSKLWQAYYHARPCGFGQQLWNWFLVTLIIFTIFIPATLYRFSIKSTSIVYLPFIYIVNSRIGRQLPTEVRLDDLRNGNAERIGVLCSVFVIVVMIISLAMPFMFAKLLTMMELSTVAQVIGSLLIPAFGEQPVLRLWHVAALLNAVLYLYVTIVFAKRASMRLKQNLWTEEWVAKILNIFSVAQVILSFYTMYCSMVIFGYYIVTARFPNVPFICFP
jgi:hypothetical protein